MKNPIKLIILLSTVVLLFTSCSKQIRIRAINPAEVSEMAFKKKIAVSRFAHDRIGFSGKVEAEIAKQKINNKRYFTLLSRRDMSKILKEQKLQSSELMDEKTSARVGKLIGAQAIISGEVASANAESSSYYEDREKCIKYTKDSDGNYQCARHRYYRVKCDTTQASVGVNVNIVDVETGVVIYGDTINRDYSADSCKDSRTDFGLISYQGTSVRILSKGQALNYLASSIAKSFVYKLTPNYIYFNVKLLDSLDLDSTSKENDTLDASLKYIEMGRYKKAKKLLENLMDSFDGKSYVVAYDYGVVHEAMGDFQTAKELYSLADDLILEPVDELNAALTRIERIIEKNREASRQINAK